MSTIRVKAKLLESVGIPLITFEHPKFGYTEREIDISLIPTHVRSLDEFEVEVPDEWPHILIVKSKIAFVDDPWVMVTFDHPRLGRCQREFHRTFLPPNAVDGSFDLAIELNTKGEVMGYNPRGKTFVVRPLEEWEKIPEPRPPEDLDDKKAMDRYEEEMFQYRKKIIPLRQKAESKTAT
jgi:hypothetical protein